MSQRGFARKRGATWTAYWSVPGPDGDRRQRSKGGFRTKAEATGHLTDQVARLRDGSYVEPDRMTMATFVREHWLPSRRSNLRAATWESYADILEGRVLPRIGGHQLTALTPAMLDELYRDLLTSGRRGAHGGAGAGLSARSVEYTARVLRKVLADAHRQGLIMRNVADQVDPPRPGRTEMHVWNAEQVRTYLDTIGDDRLAALWSFMVRIGVRRGEALGLRWADVDLDAGRVQIVRTLVAISAPASRGGRRLEASEPKTKAGRRQIKLDADTVAELRAHRRRQLEERMLWGEAYVDEGLVFTREDGTAIDPETATFWHGRWCRVAGLPPIRLHDLRHTAATLALSAGVPAKVVSTRLGHANISITLDTYSHVLDEHQDDAAEKVAALLRVAP